MCKTGKDYYNVMTPNGNDFQQSVGTMSALTALCLKKHCYLQNIEMPSILSKMNTLLKCDVLIIIVH